MRRYVNGASMSKVILRKICEDDLVTFSKLLSDPQVMEFSEGFVATEYIDTWFESVASQYASSDSFGTFAIVLAETHEVIGYCSLLRSKYTELPEIGYRIFPSFWGRGLATEAARFIVRHAFEKCGLSIVYAQVDPSNLRSIGVLRKLGMSFSHEIKPDGYDYADQIWVLER
ncbi:N-acetyltransferase [Vibrio parahaemolyticus]|nr:N-acetyltransferase [Vibrio parahaemolyticus]EGR1728244.1 N-acetyltransferase [Vibrio parahaemolyticus]